MKYGKLTPLALAVGLALISQVVQAAETNGSTIKATSTNYTKPFNNATDTYTSNDTELETVLGVNGRTLTVKGNDLTLINSYSGNDFFGDQCRSGNGEIYRDQANPEKRPSFYVNRQYRQSSLHSYCAAILHCSCWYGDF